MKRQISFLWVVFATLVTMPYCSPNITSSPGSTGMGSALMKIECREAPLQQILGLLRAGRGKDISVVSDGSGQEITAAFSPADTPAWKLEQILHDLEGLSGVLHVEVVENPHPIRQNF